MAYNGRRVLYTEVKDITKENVVSVLDKIREGWKSNKTEALELHNRRRGDAPILTRTKYIRDDIVNIVAENRADEIVSFWNGYVYGEPMQYVRRSSNSSVADDVEKINNYCYAEGKFSKDIQRGEWQFETGISYVMCLPKTNEDTGESPFKLHVLSPIDTCVVRWTGVSHDVVVAFVEIYRQDKDSYYFGYTKNASFEIDDGVVTKWEPHIIGEIPIVEYACSTRMGAFEKVLPLLDAIDTLQSNRLDDVEQFVQAFLKFTGVDKMTEEDIALFKKLKSVFLPEGGDVGMITASLNQQQIQVFKDDLYQSVLTICEMPNRNGGSSTSDTGTAVVYRDGWSAAETRAKAIDLETDASEKQLLQIMINIIDGCEAKLSDIDVKHTRKNYDNLLTKVQALVSMLASNKIGELDAFITCGLFSDPEKACENGKRRAEEEAKAAEKLTVEEKTTSQNDSGGDNGNVNPDETST